MRNNIINFDNSYINLPDVFYSKETPKALSSPKLVKFNYELAENLNINVDSIDNETIAKIFTGQVILDGSEPISQIYGGHQFGYYNILGDGRAILLGETIGKDGTRYDIQLKGAGRTAFSRNGDGLSALGPVMREYLLSEAMNNLGVPTTRALSFCLTGDDVYREKPLGGAILTRIAKSHIRFGNFQYFAAKHDVKNLKILADYVINRHYPEVQNSQNKYASLLEEIAKAHAKLVAKWMSLGFIHGVMNTDNASICGITIDYGPCAFMDNYNPSQVYSFIDKKGRYQYQNQPFITQWNLARLAECLVVLIDEDVNKAVSIAENIIKSFPQIYEAELAKIMRAKIGLEKEQPKDMELLKGFLDYLEANNLDFTNSFRGLNKKINEDDSGWFVAWQKRLEQENKTKEEVIDLLNKNNPAIIMRNHNVERAIDTAYKLQDFSLFNQLLEASKEPFSEKPEYEFLRQSPRENEIIQNTFCGT